MGKDKTMSPKAVLRSALMLAACSLASPGLMAAEPAPPAAKPADNAPATGAPKAKVSAKASANSKASSAETTLKGELTCAKCGLHESTQCQNVLRVKDAAGAETKYYLKKNAVAEEQHQKVCGGSAPATVTGKVAEDKGKKVITASAVTFD